MKTQTKGNRGIKKRKPDKTPPHKNPKIFSASSSSCCCCCCGQLERTVRRRLFGAFLSENFWGRDCPSEETRHPYISEAANFSGFVFLCVFYFLSPITRESCLVFLPRRVRHKRAEAWLGSTGKNGRTSCGESKQLLYRTSHPHPRRQPIQCLTTAFCLLI